MALPVSFKMGAGCSGAGAPFTVSSIQLTLVPSLYVWIALNSSEPVFDGSCPAETVNRSNWFGGIHLQSRSR